MYNRVWIELERPRDDVHGAEIAAQANRMLARLGDTAGYCFEWDPKERRYLWGDQMGSMRLSENGTWFNLDYLGRES